jgi:hypothetical protein
LSDLGFHALRRSTQVVHSGDTASNRASWPGPDYPFQAWESLPYCCRRSVFTVSCRTHELPEARPSSPPPNLLAGTRAEPDVRSLQESFAFPDAAGHRSVGVHQTCAVCVFSGKQKATVQRLAEQIRVGRS